MSTTTAGGPTAKHRWRFFRAGGFDQVRLGSADDWANLDQLDPKLWVALACPVQGLELDAATLELIDSDKDGRVRVPEVIAAAKWAVSVFKNHDGLLKGEPRVALSSIDGATPEGGRLLASARQVLANLGKADSPTIGMEEVGDKARIFADTRFNGDGVVAPEAADDPEVRSVMAEVIDCLGGAPDRSGKVGVTQALLDTFFAQLGSLSDWQARADTDGAAIFPIGQETAAAQAAVAAARAKVEDYFARCRLAAFDPRAQATVNGPESSYAVMTARDMSATPAELRDLPLARVEPGRALPLAEGVNPAWSGQIAALRDRAVRPLLGERSTLGESDWAQLQDKLSAYAAWIGSKPTVQVEKLGIDRVRRVLAGSSKAAIESLIARDKALEPEVNALAAVEKMIRFHRDLANLLDNFVSFRVFYGRRDKAVFQHGRLYLDQRSCDLCLRVDDAGRHATMAPLSQMYLAYCDCVRKSTGEKMTIAAAFTNGDSDNLMVGRNGVFYDRRGRDWDATITRIVDNPISIRQAFWSPYKRLLRWVQEQVAKRAAAADAAASSKLEGAVTSTAAQAQAGKAQAPGEPKKLDVGIVAALGVALGFLTTAFASILQWITGAPWYMLPVYIVLVLLLISGPSMVIAWLKLRMRNLGPVLDANGWAVNAKARVNIPFGKSLTQIASLPPGAERDLGDPYAESHQGRHLTIAAALLIAVLASMWYFGCIEALLPDVLPKSGYVLRKEAARAEKAKIEAPQAAQPAGAPGSDPGSAPDIAPVPVPAPDATPAPPAAP